MVIWLTIEEPTMVKWIWSVFIRKREFVASSKEQPFVVSGSW
jgi:hypothetical protein